ncbi:YIP1 family protein [Streptomyces gilvosporeus]|uniref:Yip1 domain-containing protein n=1 Tax=Streptomyces gilvosporeus TaxID=553510 RepID=A0A1V0TTQ6_9ACTN|nr:YIP1 family protein [Streptomyces gilvosporeus]ARF56230.1 hypothetical protein B1H19_20425 [Streptomyces gilvosporeus]
MGEYEVNSELTEAGLQGGAFSGMTPQGEAAAESNRTWTTPRRTYRLLILLLMLAIPLANLTLLGQYRDGVVHRVPDADAGAVKAGVAAAWLFGSVLNALGVLFIVLIAGAVGAVACRLAGSRGSFADDRTFAGLAVSGFLLGKLLVLALGSALFSLPATDHIVAVLGGVDPALAVLAAACVLAVRHSARLSWPRSVVCAMVPTAFYAVVCLITRT